MLSFLLVITLSVRGEQSNTTIMSVRDHVKSWLQEQEPHRITYRLNVFDESWQWSSGWSDNSIRNALNGSFQSVFPLIRFPTLAGRDSF